MQLLIKEFIRRESICFSCNAKVPLDNFFIAARNQDTNLKIKLKVDSVKQDNIIFIQKLSYKTMEMLTVDTLNHKIFGSQQFIDDNELFLAVECKRCKANCTALLDTKNNLILPLIKHVEVITLKNKKSFVYTKFTDDNSVIIEEYKLKGQKTINMPKLDKYDYESFEKYIHAMNSYLNFA